LRASSACAASSSDCTASTYCTLSVMAVVTAARVRGRWGEVASVHTAVPRQGKARELGPARRTGLHCEHLHVVRALRGAQLLGDRRQLVLQRADEVGVREHLLAQRGPLVVLPHQALLGRLRARAEAVRPRPTVARERQRAARRRCADAAEPRNGQGSGHFSGAW
jgi:hypothetical protein